MRELYMTTDNFGLLPHNIPMREQIKVARDLGFQGLEHHFTYDEALEALLKEFDLKVIDAKGRHIKDDGTIDHAEMMQKLGVRYIETGMTVWDHESALRAADRLNPIARQVKARYGFKVFVHNLAQEFLLDQGEYLLETVLKNTDADCFCSQLDLGWIICAGLDPVAFLEKLPGRIELMHVKPCTVVLGPQANGIRTDKPQPPRDMSTFLGTLKAMQGPLREAAGDYRAAMEAAERLGCQAFVYEREESYHEDRMQAFREDIAELRMFW
jgi:sugar phosphate isomerase/epimerase